MAPSCGVTIFPTCLYDEFNNFRLLFQKNNLAGKSILETMYIKTQEFIRGNGHFFFQENMGISFFLRS